MSHLSNHDQNDEKVTLWLQQRGFKVEKNKKEKFIPVNDSENSSSDSRPPSSISNCSTNKIHKINKLKNFNNENDNIEHLSNNFSNTKINRTNNDECQNSSKENFKSAWLKKFDKNKINEKGSYNDDADSNERGSRNNNNRNRFKNSYGNNEYKETNKNDYEPRCNDKNEKKNHYDRNKDRSSNRNDYENNINRNDREKNEYGSSRNRGYNENNCYRNNKNRNGDKENNDYGNRTRHVDGKNNSYGNNRNRDDYRENNRYKNYDEDKNFHEDRDKSNNHEKSRNFQHRSDRSDVKDNKNRQNENNNNENRNRRQNYGMRDERYENSNRRQTSRNDRNEYQNKKEKNNEDDWDSDSENQSKNRNNNNSRFQATNRPGSGNHRRSEKGKNRPASNNEVDDLGGSSCSHKPRKDLQKHSNNKDDYFRNNIYEKNFQSQGRAPKVTYIPPEENDEDLFKDVPKSYNIDRFVDFSIEVSGRNKPKQGYSLFEESDLSPLVLKNVRKMNYTELTPIQKWAMPIINMGRDLLACSETGSGKTAAFLLPIISKMLSMDLHSNKGKVQPLTLIISPTRELAIQTHKEALKFSYNTPLKTAVLYGGASVEHQKNMMKNVHLLVVTTGRLCDFVQRNMLDLSNLKFLVLDEGDQMLSDNFVDSINFIIDETGGKANPNRQTMFFSATFPIEVQKLSCSILNDYIFVAVGILGQANLDIKQEVLRVPYNEKTQMVTEILKKIAGDMKTIVFLNKKKTADSLCISLSEILETSMTAIHGDLDQKERETVISSFRKDEARVLMATSVAARGLDISNVGCVINYDLPNNIDEYVHRIGRTARCGNKGRAISFFTEPDNNPLAKSLLRILADADQEVPEWLEDLAKGMSHRPRQDENKKDYRKGRHFGIDSKKSSIIEESSHREVVEDDDDWD